MKRDVYINHSAVITGLGNLEKTWQSLLKNQSAIIKKEHFSNKLLPATGLSLYQRELTTCQPNFTRDLMETCLAGFPALPENTFVIWTGIKNNVELIESLADNTEQPQNKNAKDFRLWLSNYLGLQGEGMEINAACASSTTGVSMGAQLIADGVYDHVLVAGADIVSRFVYFGFAALKAMQESVCLPFDLKRNGLTLGDGAAAIYLSSKRKSNLKVSGYGITNDANHITGPSRDGAGLDNAMRGAAQMANVKPSDIEAFCAHATGTRYNDSMEIMAVRSFFGEKAPPVFGIKGAIGHTLGAAGGIEIALCGKCLLDGVLPPTIGCSEPESKEIILKKTNFPGNNILTSNSGFGGINAAVLLEKII